MEAKQEENTADVAVPALQHIAAEGQRQLRWATLDINRHL